jgi:hypothetical protein
MDSPGKKIVATNISSGILVKLKTEIGRTKTLYVNPDNIEVVAAGREEGVTILYTTGGRQYMVEGEPDYVANLIG